MAFLSRTCVFFLGGGLYQNFDVLWHCCDQQRRVIMPVLVCVFAIVVLFVCSHGSLVGRLMHRHVVFVFVPVCSYGMSLRCQPDIHSIAFSVAHVNTRTQRKDYF